MSNAVIAINGASVVPTLLGQGPVRIPTGGKIRPGIKVLTRKAAEQSEAKAIYDRGMAAGQSFDAIERAINAAVPELQCPLVPKNVPWFTVRPDEFPNPETARAILAAYGEDRGDGTRRLYRFPVVFPADQWQTVMPHELVAWGASEKKYWSEYAPDGRVRYCKCYAPVPMDDSGKRAIRLFGGRKITLREDNSGLCDPELCREYQNRQCNLSGCFIFFIPGIKSIGAFELHTTSFYAMNGAIQKFETIAFMRGGRISGFLDEKRTSFFITKKLMEVPHIDEDGRAVRVAHWIIELEAPVDVTALLRANDEEESTLVRAAQAARVLEGAVPAGEVGGEEPQVDVGQSSDAATSTPSDHGAAETTLTPAIASASTPSEPQAPVDGTSTAKYPNGNTPDLQRVLNAAAALGITSERYIAYAAKRWGAGWKINAVGRRRALAEIESFCDDCQALAAKIDAALDVRA